MSKLTLSIDDRVMMRAKRYAAARGTSVSRLVERYLDLLVRPPLPRDDTSTPVLARLRGSLKGASDDTGERRRHLEHKYR
jgi:hypothetical protein